MLDANLIATLEKGLQETRNVQMRLMGRLREVEQEGERLRGEIQALENSASQTETMIDSLLVTMRTGAPPRDIAKPVSSGEELGQKQSFPNRNDSLDYGYGEPISRNLRSNNVSIFSQKRGVPSRGNNIEAVSHRFADRTITQACTLLLREAGQPLHVNELYNLLVAGGMEFKGNNPTISVAVSLNRNRRFKKVGPGTFDLMIRDASSRAAS